MRGACVSCMDHGTEIKQNDDGHYIKECNNCGHIGGPYVSQQKKQSETGQTDLTQWT